MRSNEACQQVKIILSEMVEKLSSAQIISENYNKILIQTIRQVVICLKLLGII